MAARARKKGEPFKLYRMRLKAEEKAYKKRLNSCWLLWSSSDQGTARRDGRGGYIKFVNVMSEKM